MQIHKTIYLPKAGIYHQINSSHFLTVNLAKQFVIDFYTTKSGTSNYQRYSYTGIRILDKNGLYTSQFISKKTKYYKIKNKLVVKGYLGRVPTENSFNLIKNLIFRSLLLFCSKSTKASNFLKKFIRKILMFSKNKQIYKLDAVFDLDTLTLEINLLSDKSAKPVDFDLGTTISDRYVPQSKFSRLSDFNLKQSLLNKKTKVKFLKELRKNNEISFNLKLIE